MAALIVLGLTGTALAQSHTPGGMPPPTGMSLAASTAMRFPQPVRVGDLLHRDVLQPVESQNVLGTVAQLVRDKQGVVFVVIKFGGLLGFGTRLIEVPLNAMVVDGRVMEVVAYSPKQLRSFPTFSDGDTTPVPPDTQVEVGLAKPSH